jgi:hypothetical protein
LSQHDEAASKQFGAWLRSSAKVEVTPKQAAVPDAADGGKRGPEPQRSEHDRLNEAMRDAMFMGGSHRVMHDGVIREKF